MSMAKIRLLTKDKDLSKLNYLIICKTSNKFTDNVRKNNKYYF